MKSMLIDIQFELINVGPIPPVFQQNFFHCLEKSRIQFPIFLHHGHLKELKVIPSKVRLEIFEIMILKFTAKVTDLL